MAISQIATKRPVSKVPLYLHIGTYQTEVTSSVILFSWRANLIMHLINHNYMQPKTLSVDHADILIVIYIYLNERIKLPMKNIGTEIDISWVLDLDLGLDLG